MISKLQKSQELLSRAVNKFIGIDNSLREIAEKQGIFITQNSEGQYKVVSHEAGFNLQKLCPSYIRHENGIFDPENLRLFLKFLHQPIQETLLHNNDQTAFFSFDTAARAVQSLYHPWDIAPSSEELLHEKRLAVHGMLRGVTTDQFGIPKTENSEKDVIEPDCHEEAEGQITDRDLWREESELFNSQSVQSAIPGTSLNLVKGFAFRISESFLQQNTQEEIQTNTLKSRLKALIAEVQKHEHKSQDDLIYLTANELEELTRRISSDLDIIKLLAEAEFEGLQAEAEKQIAGISAQLMNIETFQMLMGSLGILLQPQNLLKVLLAATTALTPVISSKQMQMAWAEFNVSKRDRSPFNQIVQEFSVFDKILAKETEQGADPVRTQAIMKHFSSLVSFMNLVLKEFHINISKSLEKTGLVDFSVAESFLEPHHQNALKTIRKGLGQGGSPIKHLAAGVWGSMKTVFGEGFKYTTQTNNHLRWTVALSAALTFLSFNPNIIKSAKELMGRPETKQVLVVDDDGDDSKFESRTAKAEAQTQPLPAIPKDAMPKGYEDADPTLCHCHLDGTIHCLFNDKIKKMAHASLDYAEENAPNPDAARQSHFSKNARVTISPATNQLFYANIVQFLAHFPFYIMMAGRGFQYKLRSYQKTTQLFGDLTDALYHPRFLVLPAIAAGGIYGLYNAWGSGILKTPGTGLMNAMLAGMAGYLVYAGVEYAVSKTKTLITGQNRTKFSVNIAQDHSNGLSEAMEVREILADRIPVEIQDVQANVRIAGLKHKFTISSQNLQPVIEALAQFDVVLREAASQIGVTQDWYQHYLKDRIQDMTQALRDYAEDADSEKLKKTLRNSLADVMGAQAYHMDNTSIYKAVFNREADDESAALLKRHGAKQYGLLMRKDHLKRHWQRIAAPCKEWNLEEKAKSSVAVIANRLWNGTVYAARTAQATYTRIPCRKPFAAAVLGVTTASVGLDLTGQSEEMLGTYLGTIANGISGLTGYAYGVLAPGSIFSLYNVPDDAVVNDTIGGGSAMTLGVVAAGISWMYSRFLGNRKFEPAPVIVPPQLRPQEAEVPGI